MERAPPPHWLFYYIPATTILSPPGETAKMSKQPKTPGETAKKRQPESLQTLAGRVINQRVESSRDLSRLELPKPLIANLEEAYHRGKQKFLNFFSRY